MPCPSADLLEAKLLCPAEVDHPVALRACEVAGIKCGYRIASRTRRSMVLMPGPRRRLFACLAPSGAGGALALGLGITVELVPDCDGDCLNVVVTTSKSSLG